MASDFFFPRKCSSISANDFPLVSGTMNRTKKNASAQKDEYIQKVPAEVNTAWK